MTFPEGFAGSPGQDALPLHIVDRQRLAEWRGRQPEGLAQWMDAHRFEAAAGSLLVLPGEHGIAGAVLGVGDPLDPFSYAHAPFALPHGDWRVEGALDADASQALQLGWGLGSYRYTRFRKPLREPARLVVALDFPRAVSGDARLRVHRQ